VKKFFLTILTIVYMALSCGIAMEIHYCMGKQAGVEFYGSEREKCGKCGMVEKTGCCHDEHKFYKLDDGYKNVSNDINFATPQTDIIATTFPLFNWQIASSEVGAVVNNNSPPGYTEPSARIMNCVFRL
jgi:hypothetical protein